MINALRIRERQGSNQVLLNQIQSDKKKRMTSGKEETREARDKGRSLIDSDCEEVHGTTGCFGMIQIASCHETLREIGGSVLRKMCWGKGAFVPWIRSQTLCRLEARPENEGEPVNTGQKSGEHTNAFP